MKTAYRKPTHRVSELLFHSAFVSLGLNRGEEKVSDVGSDVSLVPLSSRIPLPLQHFGLSATM